jgi:hypothetical protein
LLIYVVLILCIHFRRFCFFCRLAVGCHEVFSPS